MGVWLSGNSTVHINKDSLHRTQLLVTKSNTSFSWSKGRNVTSARWLVILCYPIWHAFFCSSEAKCTLQTVTSVNYTLFYFSEIRWLFFQVSQPGNSSWLPFMNRQMSTGEQFLAVLGGNMKFYVTVIVFLRKITKHKTCPSNWQIRDTNNKNKTKF